MYQTNCPNCNGQLVMSQVTLFFDDSVPVDGQNGYSFDGDQVRDAGSELARCVGYGRFYDLNNDLYREAVPVVDAAKKTAVPPPP